MKRNTKYKDIKIEKIPEEWTVYEISDVTEVIGGGTPSTKVPEYWGGDISWITPKDLANFEFRYIKKGVRNITKKGLDDSSAKIVPKNTVLLTTRAPVGYLAIADNEVTTNQGFRSLVPKRRTKSEFLFYLLKNNIAVLKANATGTTFGELSGSVLKSLKFAFPPVEEQEAITKILSDLDSKIELNNQINKNLEQIAQAIFKHWFIDFEFPNENGKPYKSNSGEMIDSEMGLIPKGWRLEKLGNLLSEIVTGNRPKGGVSKLKEGIPSIGAESINGLCNYNFSKTKYIPELYFSNMKKGIVKNGDILLYKDGANLGRKSMFLENFPFKKCCVNSHVFILRSNSLMKQSYLFFYLDQEFMTKNIINLNTNSAQPGINSTSVKTLRILLPSGKILNLFNELVFPILKTIFNNAKENQCLSNLRDALLPKLMSGEIRVPIIRKF